LTSHQTTTSFTGAVESAAHYKSADFFTGKKPERLRFVLDPGVRGESAVSQPDADLNTRVIAAPREQSLERERL